MRSLHAIVGRIAIAAFAVLGCAGGVVEYGKLLAKAQQEPEKADFGALRMAYASSSQYDPYDSTLNLGRYAFVNSPDTTNTTTIDIGNHLLIGCYLNIDAHGVLAGAYRHSGDTVKADFHRAFYRGLLGSVMTSGDGRSFASAFEVIYIGEEYSVLDLLDEIYGGVEPHRKTIRSSGGSWFDVFDVTNHDDPDWKQVFFKIDVPASYLKSTLGETLKDGTTMTF